MSKQGVSEHSNPALVTISKLKQTGTLRERLSDQLAIEAPLLIVVVIKQQPIELATIMRTPGDDQALALGFLLSEHIIKSAEDVSDIDVSEDNEITLTLAEHIKLAKQHARTFTSYSGCGICGKASIKQLALNAQRKIDEQTRWLDLIAVVNATNELKSRQTLFNQTGAVHGAALVELINGQVSWLACKEDVGRHNAVDKIIGEHLLTAKPNKYILLLSGRISFELVQKAVMAGISVIAAIGAPSSLALQTAQQFNLTLLGFIGNEQANIYCNEWRLTDSNLESTIEQK
ncbi:formate dehydrogenase accessory sulfurtransferase FdhD [Thalassotalea sp. LPB0316]|uniref:formate dehydrogenase accessory sulfurtransferase FdhD n=1 Tax=Thalassotalea sp. LPB0316 TaxID=2769490 RepID=UPI00186610EF|nr:formate dehydrogenase accessory sulfurtransferase FdhD [Thalassotalea sp. LPB0316]QOL26189.1 formate dehydrogenase accessory sulfurtransferase FdhD [Thalassotalea sp. LPB0316]